jgi:hypothetical protein
MDFMFSFSICNESNKNKKQEVKYNKMTCDKMEYQIESFYFNLLKTRI